jgi:hypothetical protein
VADPATSDDSVVDPKAMARQLGLTTPPDYSGNIIDLAKRTEKLSQERTRKIDPLVDAQAKAAKDQPEASERAFREIEPFRPTPAPDQRQFQEDPLTKFASLGSVVGILASAFTHQPWTTSFTAAAAAIDAKNKGDSEAYDNAFKSWKANTDLMLERHKIQTEDWKTLQEKYKDDAIGRDAAIRAYNAKYGDEINAVHQAAGMYSQAGEIMDRRNQAMLGLEKAYNEIVPKAILTGAVLDLQSAQKSGDPEKIRTAMEKLQQLQQATAPAGKAGSTNPQNIALQHFIAENPSATSKDIAQFISSTKTTARSPQAMAMQKWLGEHPDATAEEALEYSGEITARLSAERSLATKTTGIEYAVNEVNRFAPMALESSQGVDRSQYKSINSAYESYLQGTGDENIIKFIENNNALITAYSQAVGRGNSQVTDSARAFAQSSLERDWSQGQYAAGVKQLQREAEQALKAGQDTRSQLRGGAVPDAAPDNVIKYDAQGNRVQ